MLKQIGVRLEEELIKKVKMTAIEEGISVQTLFQTALDSYFDNKLTIKHDNNSTSKQVKNVTNQQVKKQTPKQKPTPTPKKKEEDEDIYDREKFYLLKKPVHETAPETQHTRKTNYVVEWWLEEGDSQYFDSDQTIIPFRYRKADGTDYMPTPAEIKMLEEEYEKPVRIEE